MLFFFFFDGGWGSNSGLCTCKACHLSRTSVGFALFILEMVSSELFAWAGLKFDPPDLASKGFYIGVSTGAWPSHTLGHPASPHTEPCVRGGHSELSGLWQKF
jgi:hypothetical protein